MFILGHIGGGDCTSHAHGDRRLNACEVHVIIRLLVL